MDYSKLASAIEKSKTADQLEAAKNSFLTAFNSSKSEIEAQIKQLEAKLHGFQGIANSLQILHDLRKPDVFTPADVA